MSEPANRREFVGRRRFLQAIGGTAAAVGLAACAEDGSGAESARPAGTSAPASVEGASSPPTTVAVADDAPPAARPVVESAPVEIERTASLFPTLTRLADLRPADDEVHATYVPDVPEPVVRTDQRIVEVHLEVVESVCPIDPSSGLSTAMWGFRLAGDDDVTCPTPGPVIRARVGDLVRITLSNPDDAANTHNIEFHALTGPGGGAPALTVAPGESATVNGRLLCPGVFLYHCAAGDVPMHVAHGMYGMFIVDPEEPLPAVDHEWAIVRSEWYVGLPDEEGIARFDPEALLLEHPRYVTLNGRTDALERDAALRMDVGERARLFIVNAGLNLGASFQAGGAHWDLVYPEGATHPLNHVIRGTQATSIMAGASAVAELVGYVPSTITLLDHSLVRPFAKGGSGTIEVSGDDNGLFSIGDEGLAAVIDGASDAPPRVDSGPAQVVIPVNAWMLDATDVAFTPNELSVPVGTTVRWENADSIAHTVTSGTSDGTAGSTDDRWDSGVLENGDTFEFTFSEAGTYDYFCQPHPWMRGRVTVTD